MVFLDKNPDMINVLSDICGQGKRLQLVEPFAKGDIGIADRPYALSCAKWCKKKIPSHDTVSQLLLPELQEGYDNEQAAFLLQQMSVSSSHKPQEVVRVLNASTPDSMRAAYKIILLKWVFKRLLGFSFFLFESCFGLGFCSDDI